MTDPERPTRPITEGYVRKFGQNRWPSQITKRPPIPGLPGPMNGPRALAFTAETEPCNQDANLTDPGSQTRPITEGYVRKFGQNRWPSQVTKRPPLPGPMTGPRAPTLTAETEPCNQDANLTDPERLTRPITEGYVRKFGQNRWPSQVTKRPPLPGPMNGARAKTSTADTAPREDSTD